MSSSDDKKIIEFDHSKEIDGYCPTCGACGHEGCCPPTKCKKIQCDYGETYAKDYSFSEDLSNALYELFKDDERAKKIHSELFDKHYKK